MPDGPLLEQAERFALNLTSLLQGSLPAAPVAYAELLGDRVVVRPEEAVALSVDDEVLASLKVHMQCRLDSRGTWLAVESSTVALVAEIDRTPIFRFDYLRNAQTCPAAHFQFHAHRGALTYLLSQSGHRAPHDMSALHIPVGGSRFRPCLEDVIQFLIQECGFDSLPDWKRSVEEGRARWRKAQACAVVRDFQADAAEVLRSLGYHVEPPSEGSEAPSAKALHSW